MERINIAGAGLAGLSAAITLAEKGIACNLISIQPSERAQSVLAEGGINAALNTMGESDTTEEHFADTMRGGADLADPNAVAGLVTQAPEIVAWLVRLGAPLQRNESGVLLRNFGGQKKKRTAYAKSSTGKIMMSALIDQVRKFEAAGIVTRYPHHEVTGLCFDEGDGSRVCTGLVVLDLYSGKIHECAGSVILATGGLNGFFPEQTTGTVQNTGKLAALLFAAGVRFANLEFIQYHPTTAAISGKRMLVSEAARAEGGRLYVMRAGEPWYFMEELYPELGNLMPRDVVSREMVRVCESADCGDQVYLDMTDLGAEVWDKKLSDMRAEIIEYLAIDPADTAVPVSPGIHFFMGGIAASEDHETNIPGLYAAGECACQYHGANRLGGNSMLSALYGGRVAAARAAAAFDLRTQRTETGLKTVCGYLGESARQQQIAPGIINKMRDILLAGLAIVRSGEVLTKALEQTDQLLARPELNQAERNHILLGKAMLLSAAARQESRGAQYRTDYPRRNDAQFDKTTIAFCDRGTIKVQFEDIPKRRGQHEDHI